MRIKDSEDRVKYNSSNSLNSPKTEQQTKPVNVEKGAMGWQGQPF